MELELVRWLALLTIYNFSRMVASKDIRVKDIGAILVAATEFVAP